MNELQDTISVDTALIFVFEGILAQVEAGMSFEHARGSFLSIAGSYGFSPDAPTVKNGTYALYLAWRKRALEDIANYPVYDGQEFSRNGPNNAAPG